MPTSPSQKTKTLELTAPEKLNDLHILDLFDSGEPSITEYLLKQARKAQSARQAAVYVSCEKGTLNVMAYYTLSNGSVERSGLPKRLQRNSPNIHPITLLGRMGVTLAAQGQGFSIDLLQDAIERAISASETVASSAIIVHPLNERLADFYGKHAGFKPCPELSPITMILPLQ